MGSGSTTIILSNEAGAEIELEGNASGSKGLDLADAGAAIQHKMARDIAFTGIARSGLTPLICLSRIRPRNKWLAFFGWTEKSMHPLLTETEAGETAGAASSDTILTQLSPDISPDQATELGMQPDEIFHVIEIE